MIAPPQRIFNPESLLSIDDGIIPESILESYRYVSKLLESYPFALELLNELGEYHDNTKTHSLRTAMIATNICESFNLDQTTKIIVVLSALLHDVGKLKVPMKILASDEVLPKELKDQIRQIHTSEGPNKIDELNGNALGWGLGDQLSFDHIKQFIKFIMANHHNKQAKNLKEQILEQFPEDQLIIMAGLSITIISDIVESTLPIGEYSSHPYGDRLKRPDEVLKDILPHIAEGTDFCDWLKNVDLTNVIWPIIIEYVDMYRKIDNIAHA